ncbi:MAG: putative signal transducing protein [Flavobacteriaceae bacterium]
MSPVYKKVFTGSTVDILSLKDAFNAENIIPVIKDNAESGRLAGFGAPIEMKEVFVHPDELDAALKILKQLNFI